MSRGFVKEDDLEHAGTDLPERPVSAYANYVTPFGLKALQQEASRLELERARFLLEKDNPNAQQALAKLDRDLRYVAARLDSAQLVEPAGQPKDKVLFGATVRVEDEAGEQRLFHLVGEDEADIAQQKVSYVSPIANALIGRKVGDSVVWQRPAGALLLEIIEIIYEKAEL